MVRELNPTATQHLTSQVAIPADQAAAVRRLIAARPAPEHADLTAALGLDTGLDQP